MYFVNQMGNLTRYSGGSVFASAVFDVQNLYLYITGGNDLVDRFTTSDDVFKLDLFNHFQNKLVAIEPGFKLMQRRVYHTSIIVVKPKKNFYKNT